MLYVRMFGGFNIYTLENGIKKEMSFPAKSGCVLGYLLLNRERSIMKEELMDIFWMKSLAGNPISAFKSLIFRLRTELNRSLGEAQYILEHNGAYKWNEEIEVEIDTEVFQNKIAQIRDTCLTIPEKTALCESALEIYKGDFLCNARKFYWADLTSGYYRSLKIKLILQLISLYKEERRYDKIEELCEESIKEKMIDEEIFYYLILAKTILHKTDEARKVYRKAFVVLREELGIEYSERIESLKDRIRGFQGNEPRSLESFHNEIEGQEIKGAYSCSYAMFMEICRLEYRKMIREAYEGEASVVSRHILLMNVSCGGSEEDPFSQEADETVMKKIGTIIQHNIRVGDVICRCSGNQYVFLLLGCSIEDCMKIMQRIKKELEQIKDDIDCNLQYQQLTAARVLQKKANQTAAVLE